MTTATRPDDIRDVHLSAWVAKKTEKWTEGHWGQCDYDESAWRTFKTIIDEDGPDSIVCWASARVVTEANYLMQKFARVALGTNNVDNCSRT